MSARAIIVLPDALATPVNHSFIPLGRLNTLDTEYFEDQSGSDPAGYNRISIRLKRDLSKGPGKGASVGVNRVVLTVHTPVMETIGVSDGGIAPPASIAYIPAVRIEFTKEHRTTLQKSKDLRKYAIGLLSDPQVIAAVELNQGIF